MKKVSILGITFLTAIAFSVVMFFNACTSDPCKDVTCLNGGTCVSGTCDCASGYEGSDCATLTQSRYVGTYSAADVCSSGNYTYTVTITPSSTDVTKILIQNAGGFGSSVTLTATVNGSNFTIAAQTFGAVTLSGSGTLSADNITVTLTYTANDTGGGSDQCSGVWTKQ